MNIKIGKYKFYFDFKIDKFPSFNLRPFLAGFIVVFIFSLLSNLGLKLPEFHLKKSIDQYIWTNSIKESKATEDISPKLKQRSINYKLNKETKIIPQSIAGGLFENASSYIVADFDSGNILMEKDASQKLPIASLTKIMTAVVALDLADQAETFTVSEKAANMVPTKIGVIAGEKMTLEELLNGLMLTSGNDAAQVIKEGVDSKYGKGTFIKAMNEKAKFLGLRNTSFSNPQGFDSINNYSSAEDLTILSQYYMSKYPLLAEIAKKDYQFYSPNENHGKQFDLYNWNGLLDVYPGAIGLKIGNTDAAGYTTSVVAEREGKKLIAVLLGTPGIVERDLWAAQLLDAGFEKLGITSANITEDQLMAKYGTWQYFN